MTLLYGAQKDKGSVGKAYDFSWLVQFDSYVPNQMDCVTRKPPGNIRKRKPPDCYLGAIRKEIPIGRDAIHWAGHTDTQTVWIKRSPLPIPALTTSSEWVRIASILAHNLSTFLNDGRKSKGRFGKAYDMVAQLWIRRTNVLLLQSVTWTRPVSIRIHQFRIPLYDWEKEKPSISTRPMFYFPYTLYRRNESCFPQLRIKSINKLLRLQKQKTAAE